MLSPGGQEVPSSLAALIGFEEPPPAQIVPIQQPMMTPYGPYQMPMQMEQTGFMSAYQQPIQPPAPVLTNIDQQLKLDPEAK